MALQEVASQFARDIDAKGAALALRQLAKSADNAATDELSVLLQINRKLGGSGLAELLSSHSSRVRRANAQQLAVATKVTATLAMAKLGVLAPWVLLALLLSRSESATAFNTVGGLGVLLGGLAVSVIAYRLTSMLGRSEEVLRVYSPYGKA
jgi:tight adherence protein B